MGETQNLRNNRVEKYDPKYGRFVRDIKFTDLPNIGFKGAPAAANTSTDWNIITYTVGTGHAVTPYLFTAHSTNTAAQFIIYKNNTTTALSIQVNDTENTTVQSPGCNCPLLYFAPLDTMTVVVPGGFISNTTDTYAAFIVANREPIVGIVEN